VVGRTGCNPLWSPDDNIHVDVRTGLATMLP
jgi:hypothetical protein